MPDATKPLPNLRCPLCGGPNDCAPATCGSFDTPCWCSSVVIPHQLLDRVPADQRGRSCICARCIAAAPGAR